MEDTGSATTEPAPAPASPPRSNWTGGRVVGMIATSIGALFALALLLGGLALIGVHSFARDDDGFLSTGNEPLHSEGYAVSTDQIDLGTDPGGPTPDDLLGKVRITVESPDSRPLFLGIARTADVERYLANVAHSQLTDFVHDAARYDELPGGAPARPPAAERIWAARSQGPGVQQVDWDAESGVWSAVVMNADASRGVSVEADVGVEIDWLLWVGIGLAIVGAIGVAIAIWLIIVISRRAAADPRPG
jgi:hypothetical protein